MAGTPGRDYRTLDECLRLLARAGLQTQRELDRAHDVQLGRWWRCMSEIGVPFFEDWVRATMPASQRLQELEVELELERTSVRRREFDVGLEINARPIHRFYQAVYETTEGAGDRIALTVAAVAPTSPTRLANPQPQKPRDG